MCEAGIGVSPRPSHPDRARYPPHPLSDRAINKGSRSHWNCGTLQKPRYAAISDGPYVQRIERLMAEMMAFSELVIIEESMPTPQITVVSASSPISHST